MVSLRSLFFLHTSLVTLLSIQYHLSHLLRTEFDSLNLFHQYFNLIQQYFTTWVYITVLPILKCIIKVIIMISSSIKHHVYVYLRIIGLKATITSQASKKLVYQIIQYFSKHCIWCRYIYTYILQKLYHTPFL